MEDKKITNKFELNCKVLENFDEIISTKLDEIEEIKITELDKKLKLLNIISLCANLKTLIIEGDQRLDTDKILNNVFKPELLEKLVLSDVKLPSSKVLKKYSNLKILYLKNIRIFNIKNITDGIINPQNLQTLTISNTDIMNSPIELLEKFSNLKNLKFENVTNCNLKNLNFLRQNTNLLTLDIGANKINLYEINNLLKCKAKKNLNLELMDKDNKIIKNAKLQIDENESKLIFPIEKTEEFARETNLYKIDKICVFIISNTFEVADIRNLKRYKRNIEIIVQNFSILDLEQAKKIKDILKLEKIGIKDRGVVKEYNIDTYIEIRTQINQIVSNVSKHVSQPEKFLEIYRFLGKEFEIIDEENTDLKEKCCSKSQIPKLLQSCLQCMNINSTVVSGQNELTNQKHSWNQVELDGKWYNVDLNLDAENIKKKKVNYCLLGDKSFLETHTPKSGKNNYCPEDFNPKLINVFFKTGMFKEKLMGSYFELTLERIKKLFNFNKTEKILALPSGDENKDENKNEIS